MNHQKVRKITAIIFYIILTLVLVATACIGMYAYSLINNPDYITIGVGESYTLKPKVDEYDEYLVRSYNPEIVSPSSASTVIGNEIGDAIVGIKYTYFKRDFYRFMVIDEPKSIKLNYNDVHLGVGEIKTLIATCSNKNHNYTLDFSSSDEKVATVNSIGTITAVNVGECKIYATAYNGIKTYCTVTVSKAPSSFSLSETSLTLGEGEEIILDCVFSNDEYTQSVEFIPSDEEIVSVTNENVITAKNAGECTVFARSHNGKTAQCDIKVKKMPDSLKLLTLDKYDVDTDINLELDMGKDSYAHNVEITVSDPDVLEVDEENPLLLHPKSKGKATITAKLKNGVTAEKSVSIGDYSKHHISFTTLNQFPTLPTGCEVVSLTSILNHYGFDVGMTTMADKYMPRYDGSFYNVSPHDYFLGTPYTWDGFGCFSGCIVKTAENYFDDKNIKNYTAVDISGCSLDELYNYLNNDIPVITWVTSGFVNPTNDGSWTVDGETFSWCNHEHCLVTIGYDKNAHTVTVADNSGGYNYSLSMSQYENVFKGMGSMAVVILEK